MYQYILYSTIETNKERLFNQKCYGFLNVMQPESLIKSPCLSNQMFESNILTTNDINRILLKKYVIAKYTRNETTSIIDSYLNGGSIEHIDYLITTNDIFKLELLKIYLQNLNYSSHDLSIEKAQNIGYERLAKQLLKIDEYYDCKDTSIKEETILKKSKIL